MGQLCHIGTWEAQWVSYDTDVRTAHTTEGLVGIVLQVWGEGS